MIELMRPIITSNGTGIDGLVCQRIAATEALRGATEALRYMAPNGRDYIGYPEQFATDRALHYARISILKDLEHALTQEALEIRKLKP